MGHYTKFVNGKLETFVAYLYSMPLQFSFTLEIRCENMNTAFKIDQAVREFFYKNKTYHINYRGTVVPVRVGFPENGITGNPGSQYTMGQAPSENFIKLSFNIQAETYQPVFDPYTEMPADVSINKTAYGIWVNNTEEYQPKRTGDIEFKTKLSDAVLVSGQDICLEWVYRYMDRDLMQVDICYQTKGDEREYVIDSVDNHDFYHWQIPMDFTGNQQIDIIIPNSEYINVANMPEIFIYPDPKTRIVEPENVYIKDKGFFVVADPNGDVPAIISYTNKKGEIVEHDAVIHLSNYMIDPDRGIEFKCFPFEADMKISTIRFIVKDHYQKENKAISDWVSIV